MLENYNRFYTSSASKVLFYSAQLVYIFHPGTVCYAAMDARKLFHLPHIIPNSFIQVAAHLENR
ncbi:hypothetical protein T10_12477 [Trichinella papuae]|uniref:Uncharacterized protein n=1 Tax=Trichinella papuae TaxID=268474 RepID=A0A0V1MLC1_9BILA|nr:hypothetical protein T10_12477 [Trichinella papuae]